MDPDQLEAMRQASYEDDDQDDDEVEDVFVYPVNSNAVRVFIACRWQREAVQSPDGTHLFYVGIEAQEVASVADLLGIDRDQRAQVLEGVRFMESIALPLLNT